MNFDEAYQDADYQRIQNSIAKKFRGILDESEILSEKLLALWRATLKYDDSRRCSFHTYLWRVTANALLDRVRRLRLREKYVRFIPEEYFYTLPVKSVSEEAIDLKLAMNLLPPEESDTLRLYYFDQRNFREIGRLKGLSGKKAAKLVRRSLENLKSYV